MTRCPAHSPVAERPGAEVRHFRVAVGETQAMHRVSDRAVRRARADGERAE